MFSNNIKNIGKRYKYQYGQNKINKNRKIEMTAIILTVNF